MRAVAIRMIGASPELMELPTPTPEPGEVLVRVEAAAVNPMDWRIAAGEFEGQLPHVYPLVLGVDAAGTVEAVGERVQWLRPGEAVYGQFFRAPLGTGAFAEYVAVPERMSTGAIWPAPVGYSASFAAALPTAGITAVGALDLIGPAPGRSVLVVGATGGVGAVAVQLAAMQGADVVGTARPDAARWIRALGASETVDHSVESVVDRVRALHPDGIDGLLDLASDAESFAELVELVRDGGTAVSAVYGASPKLLDSGRVKAVNYALPRPRPDDPPYRLPSPSRTDLLARLTAIVEAGGLETPVQSEVRLADAPAAVARNRAGHARGKTVVRI